MPVSPKKTVSSVIEIGNTIGNTLKIFRNVIISFSQTIGKTMKNFTIKIRTLRC